MSSNTSRKRGPKPYPEGPHNQLIARRIGELIAAGHVHLGGGPLTEWVIATPHGKKKSRRPDITTRAPDGVIHHENVGQKGRSGEPVRREVEALDDLEAVLGVRPRFWAYGLR